MQVEPVKRFKEIENVLIKTMNGEFIIIPKIPNTDLGPTTNTRNYSDIKCNYDLFKLNPKAGLQIRFWILSLNSFVLGS